MTWCRNSILILTVQFLLSASLSSQTNRAKVDLIITGGTVVTIDAKGKLVLPGFINGHTHVPMTLFRGLHDDVTLNDWLYKYIFPAEKNNVNDEFVRWGTRLAEAEQIRAGVTTFAD